MAAIVNERLAETFVELADTLVGGFDLMEFLHLLTERCVELLEVDAAGLLLADGRGTLQLVAASTEQARLVELFQIQVDQGPCLEAGKMPIEKEFFDLSELLSEILDETVLVVSTHQVSLNGSGPAMVNADREKINSVITNLVSNAVKYSPRGKTIEIGYRVKKKTVLVSVKDEGMGIKPEDLENVFTRFYRVETNDTRHISGFGIGLYLSAEIIERHNGKIWAESEIGKGSVFYFELPL